MIQTHKNIKGKSALMIYDRHPGLIALDTQIKDQVYGKLEDYDFKNVMKNVEMLFSGDV